MWRSNLKFFILGALIFLGQTFSAQANPEQLFRDLSRLATDYIGNQDALVEQVNNLIGENSEDLKHPRLQERFIATSIIGVQVVRSHAERVGINALTILETIMSHLSPHEIEGISKQMPKLFNLININFQTRSFNMAIVRVYNRFFQMAYREEQESLRENRDRRYTELFNNVLFHAPKPGSELFVQQIFSRNVSELTNPWPKLQALEYFSSIINSSHPAANELKQKASHYLIQEFINSYLLGSNSRIRAILDHTNISNIQVNRFSIAFHLDEMLEIAGPGNLSEMFRFLGRLNPRLNSQIYFQLLGYLNHNSPEVRSLAFRAFATGGRIGSSRSSYRSNEIHITNDHITEEQYELLRGFLEHPENSDPHQFARQLQNHFGERPTVQKCRKGFWPFR